MRHRTPIPRTVPPSPAPLLGIACQCARIGDNVQSSFLQVALLAAPLEQTPRTRLFTEMDANPVLRRLLLSP